MILRILKGLIFELIITSKVRVCTSLYFISLGVMVFILKDWFLKLPNLFLGPRFSRLECLLLLLIIKH